MDLPAASGACRDVNWTTVEVRRCAGDGVLVEQWELTRYTIVEHLVTVGSSLRGQWHRG